MRIDVMLTEQNRREVMQDTQAGANAENELAQSDYIVIKIAEAIAEGDAAEAERIRAEHAADLERRKLLRKMINDIKAKWESK